MFQHASSCLAILAVLKSNKQTCDTLAVYFKKELLTNMVNSQI